MQNNKIYVGKTTTCIRDRFSKHVYEANTPNTKGYSFILHKAMRKYGIENFQIEQIEDVDNDLINEREIYWIKFYNSMIPNGYNMTLGGEGSAGRVLSDEAQRLIMKLFIIFGMREKA